VAQPVVTAIAWVRPKQEMLRMQHSGKTTQIVQSGNKSHKMTSKCGILHQHLVDSRQILKVAWGGDDEPTNHIAMAFRNIITSEISGTLHAATHQPIIK